MIRAGIVGISGFSGKVLLDILLKHTGVRVTYVAAHTTTGRVDHIWPEFKNRTDLVCEKYTLAGAVKNCDVIFLALPHTESMNTVDGLLAAGKKVIDLSADYRLKKVSLYKKWYHVDHKDSQNLSKAVYGLPELFREKVRKARLVANPGCYPTAAILGLAPMVSIYPGNIDSLTIDAKSGVSGAGRKVAEGLMHSFVNENFKAYRVLNHQHTPEIDQYLSHLAKRNMNVTFVPHLLPIDSGILETIYIRLKTKIFDKKLFEFYRKFYKTETFVRVLDLGSQPEIRNIVKTNFCDIGLAVSEDGRMVVVTSAIDNLVKGASGQAVQNMNVMFGFKETEGLL
ncbi:MAG: N-acetyl-gamma-glutamyl-phosphate reductase [Candidatus Omnitrophica bacterium]|nr:N-acetyl-gamma-glutamyl-phosphate reductase [Candidatus Omnitrophota bacterium]